MELLAAALLRGRVLSGELTLGPLHYVNPTVNSNLTIINLILRIMFFIC